MINTRNVYIGLGVAGIAALSLGLWYNKRCDEEKGESQTNKVINGKDSSVLWGVQVSLENAPLSLRRTQMVDRLAREIVSHLNSLKSDDEERRIMSCPIKIKADLDDARSQPMGTIKITLIPFRRFNPVYIPLFVSAKVKELAAHWSLMPKNIMIKDFSKDVQLERQAIEASERLRSSGFLKDPGGSLEALD